MKDEILDDGFLSKNEVNNLEDVKKVLREAGINNFFEHKNGYIIVEESDAVKVAVFYRDDIVSVKPQFPKIGNIVQIIVTVVLLIVVNSVVPLPFPINWIVAIGGGQFVSFKFHSPKSKKLKERIEKYF